MSVLFDKETKTPDWHRRDFSRLQMAWVDMQLAKSRAAQ
jgi:hypothetical protein